MTNQTDQNYQFVSEPKDDDYRLIAEHLLQAPQHRLHSALWPRRAEIADRLRGMRQEPGREAHRAVYHALRLLIW
jgi:hypothetical protein